MTRFMAIPFRQRSVKAKRRYFSTIGRLADCALDRWLPTLACPSGEKPFPRSPAGVQSQENREPPRSYAKPRSVASAEGQQTKELTMELSAAEQTLRNRVFKAMLEATFPLQSGPDQEMILQALIRAAEMLKERFEQELEELRQESD